jgi:hypothetical protein
MWNAERFAQERLGHNSKAVHRDYAKRALVKIPSLEDYDQQAAAKAELAAWMTRTAGLETVQPILLRWRVHRRPSEAKSDH